jgi:hypothetical protein
MQADEAIVLYPTTSAMLACVTPQKLAIYIARLQHVALLKAQNFAQSAVKKCW